MPNRGAAGASRHRAATDSICIRAALGWILNALCRRRGRHDAECRHAGFRPPGVGSFGLPFPVARETLGGAIGGFGSENILLAQADARRDIQAQHGGVPPNHPMFSGLRVCACRDTRNPRPARDIRAGGPARCGRLQMAGSRAAAAFCAALVARWINRLVQRVQPTLALLVAHRGTTSRSRARVAATYATRTPSASSRVCSCCSFSSNSQGAAPSKRVAQRLPSTKRSAVSRRQFGGHIGQDHDRKFQAFGADGRSSGARRRKPLRARALRSIRTSRPAPPIPRRSRGRRARRSFRKCAPDRRCDTRSPAPAIRRAAA